MDEICRLCLTISREMACKLSDKSETIKELTRLNIKVRMNETFPSYICSMCYNTLENFKKFVENVQQNQVKLVELCNENNLNKYYDQLKFNKNLNIKSELDEVDENFDNDVYLEIEIKSDESIKPSSIDNLNTMQIYPSSIERRPKRKMGRSGNISNGTIKKIKPIPNNNIVESNNEKVAGNEKENDVIKNKIQSDFKIEDYKCLTCFENLQTNSILIDHYRTVHNMSSEENKMSKLIQDVSDDMLKVNQEQNEQVKTDNGSLHTSDRIYNCKLCGRTFSDVYAIVRHGRAHGPQSLHCSHGCGYSTVYRGAMQDHEKRHKKDFKFKCETCGAGFHAKTWYEQHQNKHNNVKPFVCDVCGMAFHMHRYLTSHRTTVHQNIKKEFKRYICPHCDMGFYNIHIYKTHLEEHTGKKRYLCDVCGKVCASAEQLKYHNSTHQAIKPFTCSTCNKTFAKKFNLHVHEKAHSGVKHLCQACGKYFAQRSTLLRHSRRRHPDTQSKITEVIEKESELNYDNT